MTMSQLVVECPSPSCPRRSVQDQEVTRESWEATWLPARQEQTWGNDPQPGEWTAGIDCPRCGTEGIDPESGQLDSAEEELGTRCLACGVVSDPPSDADNKRECPHCNERLPA